MFDHLRELAGAGHIVVIVTHDPELAARCDDVHELRDGRLVASEPMASGPGAPPSPTP